MQRVVVPDGYCCPLCPNHQDEKFVCHPLVPEPLCDGCVIELDYYARFPLEELRRKWQWAETFARLAERPWDECREMLLRRQIAEWEAIERDHAGNWWRGMMRGGRWTEAQCEATLTEQLAELRAALATIPAVSPMPPVSNNSVR